MCNLLTRFRKPLCCILLLLTLLPALTFLFNHPTYPFSFSSPPSLSDDTPHKPVQSAHTRHLYDTLLSSLSTLRHNATLSTKTKQSFQMPENPLFIRTPSVNALYEYVRSATRELYADQYAADAHFHHVSCVETFSSKMKKSLPKIEVAVRAFLAIDVEESLYNQNNVKSFVSREIVTAEMQRGLPAWEGHVGIVALTDIDAMTCIGHYYGDEYLLAEFETEFAWSVYGAAGNAEHPFRKKWDYYLTIPYHSFADARLGIPENVTLAIDAYHAYRHSEFVREGGQDLTEAESMEKRSNLEEYINDPRRELYKPAMSREDLKRKNSEFVYCAVDGVLQTFVVVHKAVRKGEQLFIYYGPNYG